MDEAAECVPITIKRMKLGLIADDIPQTLVRTATNVVFPHRMSDADYAFIEQNYVEVAQGTKVSGKVFGPAQSNTDIVFKTLWPARYDLVSEHGDAKGKLDGEPLHGAQMLLPGDHTLHLDSGTGRVAIVWAQAVERGFSPFIKRRK